MRADSADERGVRIGPGVWERPGGEVSGYTVSETPAAAQRRAVIGWYDHHVQPVRSIEDGPGPGVFVVAEPVPGSCSAAELLRSGPLDWQAGCCFLRHAARACQAAVARGIAVVALAPEQLLISDHGRALVRGLGWWPDDPAYQAPEDETTPAAATYALGCLGYALLAGQAPFIGIGGETLRDAHRHQAPPPLQQHAPAVPVPVVDLIEACLAKRPSARPPDPAAVERLIGELRPGGRGVPDGVPGLVGDDAAAEALVMGDEDAGRGADPFALAGATVVAAATSGSARTLQALTSPPTRSAGRRRRRRAWRSLLLLVAFLIGALVGALVVLGQVSHRLEADAQRREEEAVEDPTNASGAEVAPASRPPEPAP